MHAASTHLAWLVLLPPLGAAAGITLLALNRPAVSARLSIGAILAAFGVSLVLFTQGVEGRTAWPWLSIDDGRLTFVAELGLRLDHLSRLMLLVVTGVGSVIHIYSWGYMRGDRSVGRYFAGLSLFSFSMLGIVLADNFLMLFICWELVGVSSYLLIGFWFERPAAADASKKAFLTNRLGDFGFLLGIILLWAAFGTLDFAELEQRIGAGTTPWLPSLVGLLIFCGAVGKSAQFPLHVWLPDAMEGPTPVSALIHAATMVAAGVYMLCRVFFVFAAPGSAAPDVIAWVGGGTALLAALIAVQQNDIKRILAYSTLSQLGYMVLAVGLAGMAAGAHPVPAMYHLTTHACFKALLFLGAGSVICALRHEQDIWRMGGLARRMPITFWTFLAATLALCGIPPFSGFFSKDAILALAWERQPVLFGLAVAVAFLTSFYMFRLVWVAFLGPAKSQAPDHARESPAVMTLPLLVLTVPSVVAGFWGIDSYLIEHFRPGEGLSAPGWFGQLTAPFHHAPVAAFSGLIAALLGIVFAWRLYSQRVQDPLPGLLDAAVRPLRDKFYFDEFYGRLIAWTQDTLARGADAVDRWVIGGALVKGASGSIELCGRLLRLVQTGSLQTYAFLFVLGAVVAIVLMLGW